MRFTGTLRGATVAIKETDVSSFFNEAKFVFGKKTKHPNLLQFYGSWLEAGIL